MHAQLTAARNLQLLGLIVLVSICCSSLAKADDPAQRLADLTSGDDARINGAVDRIRIEAEKQARQNYQNISADLFLLLQAKLYPQAENTALDIILAAPNATAYVAGLERYRATAFLQQKKGTEALLAAKAYYNVARLADTSDAIKLVQLALVMAHPQDPGLSHRFKLQQVAGAATQPDAKSIADLGKPILADITLDPKPFAAVIDAITPDEYWKFVAKGNLLLLAGRTKEARGVFESASDFADPQQASEAIENVARAIRADQGCVGPANAYILSLQQGQGQ